MSGSQNYAVPSPLPAQGVSTAPPNGVIFPSASRTAATYTSDPMYNPGCKGVRIYTDITVVGGGTIIVKIQTQDPVSDNWVDVLGAFTGTFAAVQTKTLTIYPGIPNVAGAPTTNTTQSDFLDASWRVVVTVTGTPTFSVGGVYLL